MFKSFINWLFHYELVRFTWQKQNWKNNKTHSSVNPTLSEVKILCIFDSNLSPAVEMTRPMLKITRRRLSNMLRK